MLGVQLIKSLGVRSVQLLCTEHPHRRATLLAIVAIERLFAPVAAARRLGRHFGGGGGGERGGGGGSGGGKSGGAMALLRRRQLEARQLRVVRLRAHGEALKRLRPLNESSAFVVVGYASASGSFVELGRTAVVTRTPSPRWLPLEAELPAAAPRRLYLRLQVFAWRRSGRHQLIGTAGGLLEQLAPVRGRALPLQLLTPEGRTGRGVLWLDECKLSVAEETAAGDRARDQAGGAALALRDRRQQERHQAQRQPGGDGSTEESEQESDSLVNTRDESGDESGEESSESEPDWNNRRG